MSAEHRIKELRQKLNYFNHKYYVEAATVVSDYEFDTMLRELQDLEALHPEMADPNSPTMRVGSDLTNKFRSISHAYPMLSLSNTYSLEELHEWIGKVRAEVGDDVEFCCELKFDGSAISLTYEDDSLHHAVTRGDGTRGDEVTENIRTIGHVPLVLQQPSGLPSFEVRGEVYMSYPTFDRLNAEREAAGEQLFANPRNAAAGTLKLQQSQVVAKRELQFVPYQVEGQQLPFASHSESMESLRKWGFPVSDAMRKCLSEQEIDNYIEYWDKQRHEFPTPIDGVVIKVNSYADRRKMGRTSKAPKWAVAYKFKAEQALTKLLEVSYQVGRTGAITPVANLDAVHLAGTTVKRATLHNADQIAALDLRVGDMVYVEKGGEIIPKVTGVELSCRAEDSQPLQYITHCPECSTELVRYEGEAKHYCPNQSHCRPQIVGRIIHFIRRKAMNIESLGEETVELLYDNRLIADMADLYDLRAEQLAVLPRLGEKSAANIIQSIRSSKEVPFHRVLFALGIRFVGETTAKYLAEHFHSMDAVMAATREELIEAEEVGEKIADAILDYFADEHNRSIVERLRKAGLQFEAEQRQTVSESLAGLTFVISGSFADHSRDELKALIEAHGGKNLAAVSGNTSYLLAGDKIGPAKLQKATKLGVKIISEQEFVDMIGGEDHPVVEPTKEPEQQPTAPVQGSLF
ncbi:MAG: NAD-dependent DNA ligase LigA [Alistipes sp.]|nr:NAD-dependent DNA ligase LigA [Alistipes sp.]